MGTIIRVVLLLTLFGLTTEAYEWLSFEEAQKLQKKTHKPIMIDVMRDSCHYCVRMEKNVFDDPQMAVWLEERFHLVQINLDFDELPIDAEIIITPTFFFLDEEKNLLKKIPGSWNIQDFKDLTKGIK